jgi:curved DNA-binding protein CbpA
MKDYYQILEIHPDAGLEVMNNAYRALVRKYHPDLYHTRHKSRMDARMREINEAYSVLSNSVSRAQYDRRYRDRRGTAPTQKGFSPGRIRNVLVWGIGSFLVFRFLLHPLLASPMFRLFVLFAAVFFLIRLFARPRRP